MLAGLDGFRHYRFAHTDRALQSTQPRTVRVAVSLETLRASGDLQNVIVDARWPWTLRQIRHAHEPPGDLW